jgi:SAM-dependent methyltransferase
MQLKQAVPLRARVYARERQREWQRARSLRRGIRSLEEFPEGSEQTRRDLIAGWRSGWAASSFYLEAMAAAVLDGQLSILECGTGLTTLVLASLARSTGAFVLSLEHDPRWFAVVTKELRRFGLDANVVLAPLRSYERFEWYDIEASRLPDFSLVVCDGPPNFSRGGRYGLVPVLGSRLEPGSTILLDDAARPSERETLQHWASERGIQYEVKEAGRAFAVARVQ